MQTHNTGIMSSNHACVGIKTLLVRKATGNHFIKSTSLEETQSPLVSAKLEIECATETLCEMKYDNTI